MAKNGGNNRNMFWLVGLGGFLILGAIFLGPKIMGKGKVVGGGPPMGPSGRAPLGPAIAGALQKPGFADYGVANALYGNIPSHNFAGMAVEAPSQTMPLGFHLSNVF